MLVRERGPEPRLPPAVWAALGVALVILYILAARGQPVGAIGDDSLNIMLARSLRHGAFSWPDAHGAPSADPLPGFAALLLLPVWIVEPRWDALRFIGLLSLPAALFFCWRLARRLLPSGAAVAVVWLTALNPLFVGRAGFVLPDILLLALSLALFDQLDRDPDRWLPAGLGAAAATLLRPHGFLLALCLALLLWLRGGWRRAVGFSVVAFLPLAAWLVRNMRVVGTSAGYVPHMRSQIVLLAEPGAQSAHAGRLIAAFFGNGLLAVPGNLYWWSVTAGFATVLVAGFGVARLLRPREDPLACALAAYAIGLLVLHSLWLAVAQRYVMPIIPIVWIFLAAAAQPLLRGRRAAAGILIAALTLFLSRADAIWVKSGWSAPPRYQGETMSWIQRQTPADARFESMEHVTLSLLAGRRAELPAFAAGAPTRDAWLAWSLSRGIGYLHIAADLKVDGYFPDPAKTLFANLARWARSSPYLREVFRSPVDGTVVFRFQHPDPARYLRAWRSYEFAGEAARSGASEESIRRKLQEAVRLEPTLAYAWAALSQYECSPQARLSDLETAAKADPTSAVIRDGLAALRRD